MVKNNSKSPPLVIQTKSWKSFSNEYVGDYLSKGIGYVCMKWWLNPKTNIIYERNLKTENNPMEGVSISLKKHMVMENCIGKPIMSMVVREITSLNFM